MKRWLVAVLLSSFVLPASFAKDKKDDPVAWGTLDNNAGCVIFREKREIRGMYWGVAVTTSEFYELDVVEAENYTPEQQKYREDQASSNEFQRIAARDRIKFVKIPGKVTPQLLDKARALCKPDAFSQAAQP